ncbi:MAG: DUF6259 domain-containing protein [Planctomycetota bacterium]
MIKSILLLLPLAIGVSTPTDAQVGLKSIGNGQIQLKYQLLPNGSRLILKSIGEVAAPGASYALDSLSLWKVELRDATGAFHVVDPVQSTSFTHSKSATSFTAFWTVPDPTSPLKTISVTLAATAPASDQVVEFTASVDASSTALSVYAVTFPRIGWGSAQFGPADKEIFTAPASGGQILPNPLQCAALPISQSTPRLHHPGPYSMQFFSFYNAQVASSPLLFLGTRDGSPSAYGFYKEFGTYRVDRVGSDGVLDGFLADHRQVPENNLSVKTFVSAYPYVLGFMRGDWYDATQAYRAWVFQPGSPRPWVANGDMVHNANYSSYIKNAKMIANIGIQGCNVGTADCDPDPVGVLHPGSLEHPAFAQWKAHMDDQRAFFGLTADPDPFAALAYQWDDTSFNSEWGEWAPVRPEFISAATSLGYPFAFYFHNFLWSTGAPGYADGNLDQQVPGTRSPTYAGQSAIDYALRDENGLLSQQSGPGYRLGASCVPGPCANFTSTWLDLASNFCRDLAAAWADEMFSFGAKGMYLDVFSYGGLALTYGTPPGHTSTGGGAWFTQRMVQTLENVKSSPGITDPDFYLFSEANNEVFIKDLELTYAQHGDRGGARNQFIAPLFQSVYHDYHRTTVFQMVDVPDTAGYATVLDDPNVTREVRREYAAGLFMGYAPFAGSVLSTTYTMAANRAAHPEYAKAVDMIKNYMSILRWPLAHDYFALGRRLRDPVVTEGSVAKVTVPADSFLMPYGTSQPLVYTAAFGRLDLQSFALLFMNWTLASDTSIGGGTQSPEITIDPTRFGLPAGDYSLKVVTSSGPVSAPNMTLPATTTVVVPGQTAKLFILTKI